MAVVFVALLLIASVGAPPSPDLVVVSSEAAEHTALLAQPGTSLYSPAADLRDVSGVILKLLNVNGVSGSMFGRRPPRAILTLIVAGLAPQMVNSADFPNLSALLDGAPKSVIDRIPEPRNFDNMIQGAFSVKDQPLNSYLQDAFENRAQTITLSSSDFVCRLFLGCEPVPATLNDLVPVLNGNLDNQILTFTAENGASFQLDTSDHVVRAFLDEVAMVLAASFPEPDPSAPAVVSVAFSSLQAVLDQNGIQSSVVSACFHILDVAIPRFLDKFRAAFSDRAEVAVLLLPPSHDAYITEEIRQIVASVNADGSPQSAFVYLSDRSSNGVASVQQRLSERLPMNFKILSIDDVKVNKNDPNPALYQITLWVSILLVVLVILSTGALCCGETRKDTLLYSKITPSNDKKNR